MSSTLTGYPASWMPTEGDLLWDFNQALDVDTWEGMIGSIDKPIDEDEEESCDGSTGRGFNGTFNRPNKEEIHGVEFTDGKITESLEENSHYFENQDAIFQPLLGPTLVWDEPSHQAAPSSDIYFWLTDVSECVQPGAEETERTFDIEQQTYSGESSNPREQLAENLDTTESYVVPETIAKVSSNSKKRKSESELPEDVCQKRKTAKRTRRGDSKICLRLHKCTIKQKDSTICIEWDRHSKTWAGTVGKDKSTQLGSSASEKLSEVCFSQPWGWFVDITFTVNGATLLPLKWNEEDMSWNGSWLGFEQSLSPVIMRRVMCNPKESIIVSGSI